MKLQPVTRTSTGKLPTHRISEAAANKVAASPAPIANPNKVVVSHKATPEEIKEKMEEQLRIQRAAHNKKRALEMAKNQGKRKKNYRRNKLNLKFILSLNLTLKTSFHI